LHARKRPVERFVSDAEVAGKVLQRTGQRHPCGIPAVADNEMSNTLGHASKREPLDPFARGAKLVSKQRIPSRRKAAVIPYKAS
jgi:hypothetical protein